MPEPRPAPRSWLPPIMDALIDSLTSMQGISLFLRLLRQLPCQRPATGMYHVLDHAVELDLGDAAGHQALYRKQQAVRFLQDHILAYEDKAWGDGEIFVAYRCSPGVPVDQYRDGHRYRVLISLREQKKRGDTETFRIEREIHDGFTRHTEDLQTEIDHQTDCLKLAVLFPRERPPQRAWIVEQGHERSTVLGPEHYQLLPDGRMRVQWQTQQPKRYEAYILRWTW